MISVVLKNNKIMMIRKATGTDAKELLGYLKKVGGESGNLTFGSEGIPLTEAEEIAYLNKVSALEHYTMLLGIVDDEIISAGSLSGIDRPRIRHNAEIGLSVKKAYWHQGVATAMMQALIDFAKNGKVVSNIMLSVRTDNEHAVHLYHKCGFQTLGRHERHVKINDQYFDTYIMQLMLPLRKDTSHD